MSLANNIRRVFNQSKNWQKDLEAITDSPVMLELSRRKKSLGISGLGSLFLGELFDLKTSYEIVNTTSVLNLYSSYIDCYIDKTYSFYDAETDLSGNELIMSSVDFIERGITDDKFLFQAEDLVSYIRKSIVSRGGDICELCLYLHDYASCVIDDDHPYDKSHLLVKRKYTGIFYGRLISYMLDLFSENSLSENRRKAIETYSACATFLDDYVDITEDGNDCYIIDPSGRFMDNVHALYRHRSFVKNLFNEGLDLLDDPEEKKGYMQMFNLLLFGADVFFLKKGIVFLLSKTGNKSAYCPYGIFSS